MIAAALTCQRLPHGTLHCEPTTAAAVLISLLFSLLLVMLIESLLRR